MAVKTFGELLLAFDRRLINCLFSFYSDAILVCLGDTLMSVLAGFSVFAFMGVLSNELDTDIEKVITSGIKRNFDFFFPVSILIYKK